MQLKQLIINMYRQVSAKMRTVGEGGGALNMFLNFSRQFEYTKSNEPKSNSDGKLRAY